MVQFYLLSVVTCALAGYLLISGEGEGILQFGGPVSLKDETFKLIVGIAGAATGLMKLLSPVEGKWPIVGDLIPAAVGFIAGFILIFEHFRNRTTLDETEHTEKIDRLLVRNKRIIGIAALITAVLHFLFPGALFL
ncbi:MAG: hypothetical protein FWH12_02555 [Treponema sp.]|nr:hypothetical protein [Treponema sp.]